MTWQPWSTYSNTQGLVRPNGGLNKRSKSSHELQTAFKGWKPWKSESMANDQDHTINKVKRVQNSI